MAELGCLEYLWLIDVGFPLFSLIIFPLIDFFCDFIPYFLGIKTMVQYCKSKPNSSPLDYMCDT